MDVIIFGGGTAGCACAWNCAKLGLKTLLIEKENYLGGTMTGGLVVPIMKSGDNQINTDFYHELIKNMKNNNAQITYQSNDGWLNPIILKNVLHSMLQSVGVNIKFNTNILSEHIKAIHTDKMQGFKLKILSEYIETKYLVDATGDLEICQKLNCEFLPNLSEPQPMSLRFIMSGVNLKSFSDWILDLDKDRNVTTVEHIDNQIHFSTAYTWDTDKKWALAPYFDRAVEDGVLKDSDRNYFQIFTVAGMSNSVAFNCPRMIGINDRETAYIKGKEAISRIAEFCKKYLVGFENAYISHIADKIGVRASNRIKGKYIYTINDLRTGKKFENPAVISNYPVDVHSAKKNSSTLEQTQEYQLPIESLMSCDYDNLFIIGRGLSADELAQGALRVQASCFSMGEAVAKYIKKNVEFYPKASA